MIFGLNTTQQESLEKILEYLSDRSEAGDVSFPTIPAYLFFGFDLIEAANLTDSLRYKWENPDSEVIPGYMLSNGFTDDGSDAIDSVARAVGEWGVGGPPPLTNFSPTNPLYIPHRGSGLMYPEYSMESFRAAYSAGLRILEFDVWALSDGGQGVMHDSTVDRTTTSTGSVAALTTAAFSALAMDANTWHGSNFGNALQPPLLGDVLSEFKGRVSFVIEAKNGNGAAITAALQAAGVAPHHAMVNSFALSSLTEAKAAGYAVSYNATAAADATERANCVAAGVDCVGLNEITHSDAVIQDWVNAGFKVILAECSRRYQRDVFLAMGVAGFYADDAAYLMRSTPFSTSDNFAAQTWQPGMIWFGDAYTLGATERGRFVSPDYWGWTTTGSGTSTVQQGWANPIKSNPAADDFTIDFKAKFTTATAADRWGGVWISDEQMSDRGYAAGGAATENGYHFLFRKNGSIEVFRYINGVASNIKTTATVSIADNEEVAYRVVVTPTAVALHRLDGAGAITASASVADTTHRGGFLHLTRNGAAVLFRDVAIT